MKNNSSADSDHPRAIPFIYIDKDEKYQISEEAASLFDPVSHGRKKKSSSEISKNKIAVLCVAGAYRTGKSFLMN
jgi:hypothetical protein